MKHRFPMQGSEIYGARWPTIRLEHDGEDRGGARADRIGWNLPQRPVMLLKVSFPAHPPTWIPATRSQYPRGYRRRTPSSIRSAMATRAPRSLDLRFDDFVLAATFDEWLTRGVSSARPIRCSRLFDELEAGVRLCPSSSL
jgi:hypothetical protein